MTWRDELQFASFRGIEFQVTSAASTVGRRVALHEFPFNDVVTSEDMGQAADKFTIDAFVIGDNYIYARDQLINALKQPGAGELVHPYYGRRNVVLTSPARITEDTTSGGMAKFSLDFTVVGDAVVIETDSQTLVDDAADNAEFEVAEDFAKNYTPDTDSFGIQDVFNAVQSAIDSVQHAVSFLTALPGQITSYTRQLTAMVDQINDLIRAPAAIAQAFLGAIGAIRMIVANPLPALKSYRGMLDYGRGGGNDTASHRVTSAHDAAAANVTAINDLARRLALVNAARTASAAAGNAGLVVKQDIIALQTDLATRLDVEAAQTNNPALYRALIGLRSAMVNDLKNRALTAPNYVTVQFPATIPAIIAAYDLYDDISRVEEIMDHNPKLFHPLFLPPETIEVIGG
ncbi:MAG: DNA circularization N-terminal domain-containing protein [Alphaproteobacteria bacterium]|nr:DNA circularization N-terminal domain-containing protein [Alphaproteobacteria bacterium]